MESIIQSQKKLAVIGAGISGLSLCWKLKNFPNIAITIFERSPKISGRAKSVYYRPGFIYDIGANYFNTENDEISDIILNKLPSKNLIEIKKPIHTFDKDGKITIGDETHNKKTKWNYKTGISTLADLLYNDCKDSFNIKFGANIDKIVQVSSNNSQCSWTLYSAKNEDLGTFDAIVFTPPSPNIHRILSKSEFIENKKGDFNEMIEEFDKNKYRVIYSLCLTYQTVIDNSFYALLNSDKLHDISWISIENEKEERIPTGYTTLIVQMSDQYGRPKEGIEDNIIIDEIKKMTENIFAKNDLKLENFVWAELKRWRYGLPSAPLSTEAIKLGAMNQLYFAGDFLKGRGRVLDAMEAGVNLAKDFQKDINGEAHCFQKL